MESPSSVFEFSVIVAFPELDDTIVKEVLQKAFEEADIHGELSLGENAIEDNVPTRSVAICSADDGDALVGALLEECDIRGRKVGERERFVLRGCILSRRHETQVKKSMVTSLLRLVSIGRDKTGVAITSDVYHQLSPKRQDNYRPSEQTENGVSIHRRFGPHTKHCFVVSPIGDELSDVSKRANHVYETYVKPACDGADYQAIRGEKMTGRRVMQDVEEALETNQMVVAYLGESNHGWNPNVMIEVGWRLATGLPMVFVKEADSAELPFDIKDYRVVLLPRPQEEPASQKVAELVRSITRQIQLSDEKESSWKFPHPYASVDIYPGGRRDCHYVETSRDLDELFDYEGVQGAKLRRVLENLKDRMPEYQWRPFITEQQRILKDIVGGGLLDLEGHDEKIQATVPIVFEAHQVEKYNGMAFLPVIIRHISFVNLFKLRVLYVDVTGAAKKNEQGYFECHLSAPQLQELRERTEGQ